MRGFAEPGRIVSKAPAVITGYLLSRFVARVAWSLRQAGSLGHEMATRREAPFPRTTGE